MGRRQDRTRRGTCLPPSRALAMDPAQTARVLAALAKGGKLPPSVRHQLARKRQARRQERQRARQHTHR